jgi:hypothetical protein
MPWPIALKNPYSMKVQKSLSKPEKSHRRSSIAEKIPE